MVGARIKMGNSNLVPSYIHCLIPLELHSETSKNITQREVKETEQNNEGTKDKGDHQQMDKKEKTNTKSNEKNVKSKRSVEGRVISNFLKYAKVLKRDNYNF